MAWPPGRCGPGTTRGALTPVWNRPLFTLEGQGPGGAGCRCACYGGSGQWACLPAPPRQSQPPAPPGPPLGQVSGTLRARLPWRRPVVGLGPGRCPTGAVAPGSLMVPWQPESMPAVAHPPPGNPRSCGPAAAGGRAQCAPGRAEGALSRAGAGTAGSVPWPEGPQPPPSYGWPPLVAILAAASSPSPPGSLQMFPGRSRPAPRPLLHQAPNRTAGA